LLTKILQVFATEILRVFAYKDFAGFCYRDFAGFCYKNFAVFATKICTNHPRYLSRTKGVCFAVLLVKTPVISNDV
jgi:hypothetical protein